jgi:hypothetical protein
MLPVIEDPGCRDHWAVVAAVYGAGLLEHDAEKAWPGLDPGWAPVFGKHHAPTIA